jgi:hypothetical protein
MKRISMAAMLLASGLVALAPVASAQAPAAPTTSPAPLPATPVVEAPKPRVLAPFVAAYAVERDGKAFGDATLKLVQLDGGRWRVDLGVRSTRGLMGLAGLNLQQSTVFDVVGQAYRPLSQSTVRKAVIGSRKTTGVYDWAANRAQWQGDVKKSRRNAVALQPGDMSGLLINMAVLRDAVPGTTLQYRFVDDGRVRDHVYGVAAVREGVEIDGLGFSAMRVSRDKGGGESTTLWVTEGVPMPVRIRTEDDEDAFDLRLVDYTLTNSTLTNSTLTTNESTESEGDPRSTQ